MSGTSRSSSTGMGMGTGAGPSSPSATRPSPPRSPPTRSASSSSGSGSPTYIFPVRGSLRVDSRATLARVRRGWRMAVFVLTPDIGAVNALTQAAAPASVSSFILQCVGRLCAVCGVKLWPSGGTLKSAGCSRLLRPPRAGRPITPPQPYRVREDSPNTESQARFGLKTKTMNVASMACGWGRRLLP